MTAHESNDPAPPLVDSEELSLELVALCSRFSDELFAWTDRAVAAEDDSRRVPLKLAVSQVVYTLADRLLYPTYLHHSRLIPPELTRPI